MKTNKRHRMAIRLSTEVRTALALSAERSGLPEATQAMVLLRQALARTMDSREYAERLDMARRARTREDYLHDMDVAAEDIRVEQASRAATPGTVGHPGRGGASDTGRQGDDGPNAGQATHLAMEEEAEDRGAEE